MTTTGAMASVVAEDRAPVVADATLYKSWHHQASPFVVAIVAVAFLVAGIVAQTN